MALPTANDLKKFLYAAGLVDSPTSPTGAAASLEYQEALDAALREFERETGRRIAAASETRYFDPPTDRAGRLIPDQSFTAVTSITYQGTAIPSTEWVLEPRNAPAEGRPYSWIEFQRRWTAPHGWAERHQLAITALWGYAADVSADVRRALLARAGLELLPQLASELSGGGLSSFTEADVTEQDSGRLIRDYYDRWEGLYERTLRLYRKVQVW